MRTEIGEARREAVVTHTGHRWCTSAEPAHLYLSPREPLLNCLRGLAWDQDDSGGGEEVESSSEEDELEDLLDDEEMDEDLSTESSTEISSRTESGVGSPAAPCCAGAMTTAPTGSTFE